MFDASSVKGSLAPVVWEGVGIRGRGWSVERGGRRGSVGVVVSWAIVGGREWLLSAC
jgi:hypothetical protein